MKILNKIALLLIVMLWQLMSVAQTTAVARLDTNSILIGDQVRMELSFSCPVDNKVTFPVFSDTITANIEVISQSKIDTSYNADRTIKYYRQNITITSFDSGYFAIPPLRFNYTSQRDSLVHLAETDALLLEVHTVAVDMAKDIKDIKGPMEAPFTFREALPFILIFLAVAIAAFLLYYFIKKRKKSEPVFRMVAKPKIPPHQVAIEQLEALRFKKLWQSGRIKEYHTELVDIVRDYIYGKFGVHAQEFTSDEIMNAINETATNNQVKQKLSNTLFMADMVKFAKFEPMPLEHDGSLNNAIDFVNETKHLGLDHQEVSDKAPIAVKTDEGNPQLAGQDSILKPKQGKEVEDVQ